MDAAESEFSGGERGWDNATYYNHYCDNPQADSPLFRFILYGVISLIITLFGFIANGAIIRALIKPCMRCPTAVVLIALAVMDIVVLLCHILVSTVDAWAEFLRWRWLHNAWLTFTVAAYALQHAAALAGVYTALLAAFERVVSSLCPDIGRRLCRTACALVAVVLIALFSLAFGAVRLFEIAVHRAEDCAEGHWNAYTLVQSSLGQNPNYYWFKQIAVNVVSTLWPYILMAVMLALMAVALLIGRRHAAAHERPTDAAARYKSRQYLRMVAGVAMLFLLLHLPQVLLVLAEWIVLDWLQSAGSAYVIAVDVTSVLQLLYAAGKLPVYAALSGLFRRAMLNKGEPHGVAMVDMRMGEKAAYPEETTQLRTVR